MPNDENLSTPPVEVSDADATVEDAAAAKKREENRKKKERQKKKKAADKEASDKVADEKKPDAGARWQTGTLPGGRAERRECCGGTRGLGVFACEGLYAKQCYASAPPSLSCVFDPHVEEVCGFCFAKPKPDETTEHTVTLSTTAADANGNRSYGIKLDDYTPSGGGPTEAIVTAVVKDSPNRGVVQIGDRVISVDGQPVTGGHEAAVPLLV